MRRLLASALVWLALAGAAHALPTQAMFGRPVQFFAGKPFDCILTQNICAQPGRGTGPAAAFLTTSRASTGYNSDQNGFYVSFPNNALRFVYGVGPVIEESRTNDALWSRDMTNAAWTKVGMGTAKNAVGIDGTANSATTLTATGTASSCTASCTALQTITLGSTADTYSVFLKRVSGSGAVNITINNLVGTTACTLVTTGFKRCTVTATLANPVIGIQMAGLNDVIVADWNQMEPGSFVTTPIGPTTSGSAVRAADVVTATTVPAFGPAYTLYASGTPEAPTSYGTSQYPISAGLTSSTNNFVGMTRMFSSGQPVLLVIVGGSVTANQSISGSAWAANALGKVATAFSSGNQNATFNGGAISNTTGSIPALAEVNIGSVVNSSQYFNGTISRVALWPTTALSSAQLQQITSGPGP
jgi:hypothetical protein